jgi:hypothetical protein
MQEGEFASSERWVSKHREIGGKRMEEHKRRASRSDARHVISLTSSTMLCRLLGHKATNREVCRRWIEVSGGVVVEWWSWLLMPGDDPAAECGRRMI